MANSEQPPKRGRGRPPGSLNALTKAAREVAAREGKLPHEILLDIARGNPIRVLVPDEAGNLVPEYEPVTPEQVQDAAKAAAPYYAPKISTIEVTQGISDAALDELIGRFAQEAGVGLAAGGEGQEGAGSPGAAPQGAAPAGRTDGRRERRQLLD